MVAPMEVAVLTDTAACVPPARAASKGLAVVSLHVLVGDRRGRDSREVSGTEVVGLLRSGAEQVSTSRVSPGEFASAYRELAVATGCADILSVHLSGGVSGTVEAAALAAREVADEVRVHVVDSRTVGMALGWAALDGAELAADGGGLDAVTDLVQRRLDGSRAWFYVDTLEHLRRGGRLGRAQALVGSALAIKPLLTIDDGQVGLAERVRTRGKALARVVDLAAETCAQVQASGEQPRLAVHELGAQEAADDLAQVLEMRTGVVAEVLPLDPSVGVHTGPGTLGVVVASAG